MTVFHWSIYPVVAWSALALAVAKERVESVVVQTLSASNGSAVQIPDPKAKATALVFASTTCPKSNRYAPEIARLREAFVSRGVAFFLVQVESDITAEAAAKHAKEFNLPKVVLLDPQRALAKAVGATVTPEAALLGADGALLYRGRIDDRFPTLSAGYQAPRRHELRDAIEAVLAGKPVPVARTRAVGCLIE